MREGTGHERGDMTGKEKNDKKEVIGHEREKILERIDRNGKETKCVRGDRRQEQRNRTGKRRT